MTLLTISLGLLVFAGLFLFMYGLKNRSQLSIFFGGLAVLTPIFYFLVGLVPLLVFVPPLALIISDIGKRKINPA